MGKRALEEEEGSESAAKVGAVEEEGRVACVVGGCSDTFPSTTALEAHYSLRHQHVCQPCGRSFPSERFLHLHIAENHDPIVEARQAKGERVFACFEPSCSTLFHTPKGRRLHLRQLHHYPSTFRFNITNTGLMGRDSLLYYRP